MELNRIDEVMGVITTADVVEGRMGLLTSHTFSYDFGSRTDLPGFKVPATAEEAKRARFILTWAVDNRKPPYYMPMPSVAFGLRHGWSGAANIPFAATVYMTYPGYTNCVTIPSGTPSLAFGEGTYTIPSGCYIYNASLIIPGALVVVANTAEDTAAEAGKIKYQASMDDRVVGVVEAYDSSTKELTFRIDR